MIRKMIEQLVRSAYTQGWDDCARRFNSNVLVADLKERERGATAEIAVALHRVRREL